MIIYDLINKNEIKKISKNSGIYKFTNKINNKYYIGKAVNLRSRVEGHLYYFNKKNNLHFHNSIKKHGIQNFEVEILVEGKNLSKETLNDLEIDFIRLYNSNNPLFGYNLTEGGDGWTKGMEKSKETKEKMSKAQKGKIISEETKQKISKSTKGYKHTEEAKEKIREASKRKCKQETKEKIKNSLLGHDVKIETKEKIRNSLLGKRKGIPHSKQHIENVKKSWEVKKLIKKCEIQYSWIGIYD